ncbi:hypothetical protein [Bradyrhizobium sp. CCBAU 53380]|uniref:hypothetical protein n=1 Tax=Bradyrhizobium sp. CCBAU 53380 TaxID=1325117 RepID=UPI0023031320|nr:hypothetical protein [Bradyrhizobium sp. CCBAU 53380]MDA9426251.1 hypothetical protein [Bradyrhizobium sp. CCBAU 53380]
MTRASYYDDILERRIENGAKILAGEHILYAIEDARLSQKGEELAEAAHAFGTTRAKMFALRKLVGQISQTCEERLAREMTLVYTLNELRDRVVAAGYMTKAEAAEMAGTVVPGELLDIDLYGGLLVRGRFVFLSEKELARGLEVYEAKALLNGLIKERLAA